ncbi:MAG: hypothetical protein WBG04_08645 [Haloferula sp.]
MSDDALLDAAATGGLAEISTALVSFGPVTAIGDGVDGAPGTFEVAVTEDTSDPSSTLIGEEISLLINPDGGAEFLIARFAGKTFQGDTDTALPSLTSLHLAEARIIVGNRYGENRFSTSTSPPSGSFATWISGFPSITDPSLRLATADADGDGRPNFLEYATAGDPTSGADFPICQLTSDELGDCWVRFSKTPGIGTILYQVVTNEDLGSSWMPLEGSATPDPDPPTSGPDWMRIRVPAPLSEKGFFQLKLLDTSAP